MFDRFMLFWFTGFVVTDLVMKGHVTGSAAVRTAQVWILSCVGVAIICVPIYWALNFPTMSAISAVTVPLGLWEVLKLELLGPPKSKTRSA